MSASESAPDDRAPLLPSSHIPDYHGLPTSDSDGQAGSQPRKRPGIKITLSSLFTLLFISAVVALVTYFEEGLPGDPDKAALEILESSPLIVSCAPPM